VAIIDGNTPKRPKKPVQWAKVLYGATLFVSLGVIPFLAFKSAYQQFPNGPQLSGGPKAIGVDFRYVDVGNSIDCVAAFDKFLKNKAIHFETNKHDIAPKYQGLISDIADRAEGCPNAFVLVYGHADSTGLDAINSDISWQRADEFLQKLEELDPDKTIASQFKAHGQAARDSLLLGSSDEAHWKDRRVDFAVMYIDKSLRGSGQKAH